MNFIQTLRHLCDTVIPSLTPKAGSGIAVVRNPAGFTIDCLLPAHPAACCVRVLNGTGEDLERGMAMKLDGFAPSAMDYDSSEDDLDAGMAVFDLDFPEADEDGTPVIAVLLEDLEDGEEGFAAVSGAVFVQLAAGETGADAAEPDGAGRLRPASDGSVPLPYSDASKGRGIAVLGAGGLGERGMFQLAFVEGSWKIINGLDRDAESCGIAHINNQPFSVDAQTLPLASGENYIYIKFTFNGENTPSECTVAVTQETMESKPREAYYLIGQIKYTPESTDASGKTTPASYKKQQHHRPGNLYATWFGPCLHLLDDIEEEQA